MSEKARSAQALGAIANDASELARIALSGNMSAADITRVSPILDGRVADDVRAAVPISVRRDSGMFFSGARLASKLVRPLATRKTDSLRVLDPAVGAGDLLLAHARRLPVQEDLESTLVEWSRWLHGVDIHPELVRLTKARLTLLALARGVRARHARHSPNDFFPGIVLGDGLDVLRSGWDGDLILMNPPYTYRLADPSLSWTSGRTNSAALFTAAAVEAMRPGMLIWAILPDVLRTGTRYRQFRELVTSKLAISAATPHGRFDPWTDVDVFVLRGRARGTGSRPLTDTSRWWPASIAVQTVADFFHVNVGPVVPHRTPRNGNPERFITARSVPNEGVYDVSTAERKKFQARLVTPPFVVVRRTSRPDERLRARGTIIRGREPVLVENHLLVFTPRDGKLGTCKELVRRLESADTRYYLDERIRCRHLTVKAMRDVPWWE